MMHSTEPGDSEDGSEEEMDEEEVCKPHPNHYPLTKLIGNKTSSLSDIGVQA